MPFCVDSSGWLDGWTRNYPPDVFPTLWQRIEELVDAGEIIASEEVYVELAKKDDDLHDWIQARKSMLVRQMKRSNSASLKSWANTRV